MIVRENEIKANVKSVLVFDEALTDAELQKLTSIDKKIEKMSKGLKKGFWAGLLAFVLAKISHLLITLALGMWLVITFGYTQTVRQTATIIDNPIIGLIYLILVTRFIYIKITKNERESNK